MSTENVKRTPFDPTVHVIPGITCTPTAEFLQVYLTEMHNPRVYLSFWATFPCSQVHHIDYTVSPLDTLWDLCQDIWGCEVIGPAQIKLETYHYPRGCSCQCECVMQCMHGGDPCIHPRQFSVVDLYWDSGGVCRGTTVGGIEVVICVPSWYNHGNEAFVRTYSTLHRRKVALRVITKLVLPWLYRVGGIRYNRALAEFSKNCEVKLA